MKTYSLEELKLAQAKGCRIEAFSASGWHLVIEPNFKLPLKDYRIHPADEWKARLPRLKEGAEWHRNDFTNEMLEGGYRPLLYRPLLKGETARHGDNGRGFRDIEWLDVIGDGKIDGDPDFYYRTLRPVPPEFLHPDELAKQPEAAQAPDFGEPWTVDYSKGAKGKNNVWVCEAETGAIRDRIIACVNALSGVPDPAKFVRRALAAEARVKELETDLNEAIEGRKYNSDCINRRAIERDEARADLHKARAALRLHPIAEAGPVPEGMIRLYAHRIPLGPPGAEFWSAFSEPGEEDTHCVDIYPPQ